MAGTSMLVNISNTNTSLSEFPYWRPTLAVALTSLISCLGISILILYLSLLVALVMAKESKFKPLNIIHISLLS